MNYHQLKSQDSNGNSHSSTTNHTKLEKLKSKEYAKSSSNVETSNENQANASAEQQQTGGSEQQQTGGSENENDHQQTKNTSLKAIGATKKIELRKPELKTLKIHNNNNNNNNKNNDNTNNNTNKNNSSQLNSPKSSPHLVKNPSKRFQFFDKNSGDSTAESTGTSNSNENIEENGESKKFATSEEEESKLEKSGDSDQEGENEEDEDDYQDELGEMQSHIMSKLGPKGLGAKRHTILSSMSTDEFSEETANTANMMNEAVAEILRDGGMNDKSVRIICRTITPVLTSFAQILSKSTIVWKILTFLHFFYFLFCFALFLFLFL